MLWKSTVPRPDVSVRLCAPNTSAVNKMLPAPVPVLIDTSSVRLTVPLNCTLPSTVMSSWRLLTAPVPFTAEVRTDRSFR